MKAPVGPVLPYAIGAAVAIAGIVFVVRGGRRSFIKSLPLPSAATGHIIVTVLGIVGYIAKGIVLLLVGLLFIIATLQARPQESTGLDGGLKSLREQPYGIYLLTIVSAGLICYGLYLMVKARYARM